VESFGFGIITFESLSAVPDPHLVEAVNIELSDPAIGRRTLVFPLKIGFEFVAIEAVQSILGTQPYKTQTILRNGKYQAVRQSLFNADVMKPDLRLLCLKQQGWCENECDNKK